VILAVSNLEGSFNPDAFIVVVGLLVVSALSFGCGAYASLRPGLLAVGVLMAAQQVAEGFTDFPNVEIAFTTLAPWWVGHEVRKRGELVHALAERTRELEAEQDAFARLSVRRERARIARELHDIVAHHLAVIVVQAGAGRTAGSGNGTRAAERFASIRQSGSQALAEMSRLVDILHTDIGRDDDGRKRLRLLLDQAQNGGAGLRVTPLPADMRLPAALEDSALRVVQEGLTNAIKHAPGAEVHVRLALTGDSLEVEVSDRGGSVPAVLATTGSGFGLTGMRERIEAVDGSFQAGPQTSGGWHLCVRLPMPTRPLTPAR
jgi:signal transduction histidine kinase